MPTRDPTKSTARRNRWQSKFNSRWRDLRGDVRLLFRSGGRRVTSASSRGRGTDHYHPANSSVADAEKIADFRDWFEHRLYDDVVDPHPTHQVKRGVHYTAEFVDEFYEHGLRLANADARADPELEVDESKVGVIARADRHEAKRRDWWIKAYTYLEDAARDLEKEVTREYQTAVRENWSVDETLTAINGDNSEQTTGRIPATGENRTRLLVVSVGVQIVNDAVLARAQDLGVETVGVDPETIPDDQLGKLACEHDFDEATADQLASEYSRWATAGDDRVCPKCAQLANEWYPVEAIQRGDAPMPVIDTHLGCRCRWVLRSRVLTEDHRTRRVLPR